MRKRAQKPQPKQERRRGLLIFLPTNTLPLRVLLEDIGSPSAEALGEALGVHRRTVERWLREGSAPRTALLALYYVTRWGRADVHMQAENDARAQAALAFHLKTQLDEARAQLARIGQIGEFGSANDPAKDVPTTPATPPASGPAGEENRQAPSAKQPVSHGKTKRFAHEN